MYYIVAEKKKERKKVSMSEASHVLKFKIVLNWVWSARQFKQKRAFLLKKKKSLMGVIKIT